MDKWMNEWTEVFISFGEYLTEEHANIEKAKIGNGGRGRKMIA